MSEELTFLPDNMTPHFDYSGFDTQTVEDLHLAESEYQNGKKMAARGYVMMGTAVSLAHDVLVAKCDKHNNQHSEDSFRQWCLSIGITKDTAYRLLQISAMFDSSSPRQQEILKELPPSLLYAAAKPSAPQDLVEKVKNGEISSNKEYQALLKENQQLRTDRVNAMNEADREKQRADTAEHQLEAAQADVAGLKERADAAEAREEEAWSLQAKAEARAKDAEKQLEGSRQVAKAATARADKYKAEAEAAQKQPIEAVVDEAEVERRAKELADGRIQEAQQRAAEAIANAAQSQPFAHSEQDARDAYDSILLAERTIQNSWKMAKPLFSKLPAEQRETLINLFVRSLGQMQGEVSRCL